MAALRLNLTYDIKMKSLQYTVLLFSVMATTYANPVTAPVAEVASSKSVKYSFSMAGINGSVELYPGDKLDIVGVQFIMERTKKGSAERPEIPVIRHEDCQIVFLDTEGQRIPCTPKDPRDTAFTQTETRGVCISGVYTVPAGSMARIAEGQIIWRGVANRLSPVERGRQESSGREFPPTVLEDQ